MSSSTCSKKSSLFFVHIDKAKYNEQQQTRSLNKIKEWTDTTELTNVKVAGLGKCRYLVGEREMVIRDEAEITSRVPLNTQYLHHWIYMYYICDHVQCIFNQRIHSIATTRRWKHTTVSDEQSLNYCKCSHNMHVAQKSSKSTSYNFHR